MIKNFNIGTILLLLYIIISSSYCTNLFSKDFKDAIENNKYVQHLMLILLIMALLAIFGNPFSIGLDNNYFFNIIIMTLLIYVWFIIITKLDLGWNIIIIILLAIYFLYDNYNINNINNNMDNPNLSIYDKSNIINNYSINNNLILVTIFSITIIGLFFNFNEKKVQYGGGLNLFKYWFDN